MPKEQHPAPRRSSSVLTTAELCERWGTTTQTISQRWRTNRMPAPFNADLARGWRWHLSVIERYERGEWQVAS